MKLKVQLETAEAAFKTGDSSKKGLLQEFWPDVFTTDPYLKACKLLGKIPTPPLADRSDQDEVSADAFKRLTICIRAKNMIDGKVWIPVYDGSESHYTQRFVKTPLGFSISDSFYWNTITVVGARLEYRTAELAREGAEEFAVYYNDFFTLS